MSEIRKHVKFRKNGRPSRDGGLSTHISDIELVERIKSYCKKHDVVIVRFITEAVRAYLEKKEEEDRQEALNKISEIILSCSEEDKQRIIERLQNGR